MSKKATPTPYFSPKFEVVRFIEQPSILTSLEEFGVTRFWQKLEPGCCLPAAVLGGHMREQHHSQNIGGATDWTRNTAHIR